MGFSVSLSGGSAYGNLPLNDHTNYSIANFTPTVASRQTGLLGEDDPYTRQIEEVSVTIYGTTKAIAQNNLVKLVSKIEQAEKWAAGEYLVSNPAVIFNYAPDSGGTTYQTVVYGSPENLDSLLSLRATYLTDLEAFVINGVTLLLERRGAWLSSTGTDDLTAAPSGTPMEIDLTAQDHLSPTTLRIVFPSNAFAVRTPGYIVLTDCGSAADNMFIGSPGDEAAFVSTGFTKESVFSQDEPYSTNDYLRCDPLGAGVEYEQLINDVMDGTPFTPDADMIAVFAAVRNTDQNASFNLWLTLGQEQRFVRSEIVYVDRSSGDPQIVCFGIYPTAGLPVTLQKIGYEADDATGTLDIDYVFAVGLNDSSHIIYIDDFTTSDTDACDPGGGSTSEFYLFVDPGQLTSPEPGVYATNLCDQAIGSGRFAKSYKGNAYLATKGADMGLALLFPYNAKWRYVDDSTTGDPLHDFGVRVTRQAAELSPG